MKMPAFCHNGIGKAVDVRSFSCSCTMLLPTVMVLSDYT